MGESLTLQNMETLLYQYIQDINYVRMPPELTLPLKDKEDALAVANIFTMIEELYEKAKTIQQCMDELKAKKELINTELAKFEVM